MIRSEDNPTSRRIPEPGNGVAGGGVDGGVDPDVVEKNPCADPVFAGLLRTLTASTTGTP
jgi:hypothetical protein